MATAGRLHVTVLEARLERDTETFGTQDPYVEIEHRMEKFKTKVCSDGGKEPKFGDEFDYNVKYIGDDFTMRIMNKNTIMNDDCLGEATIKISGLCLPGGVDDWWKVHYKGKPAGAIRFKGEWFPRDSQTKETELGEKDDEIAAMKEQMHQQQMQMM